MRDQLKLLLRDREHQTWRKEYVTLVKKKELTADEKHRKKVLFDWMKVRRQELKISKTHLEKYVKVCGARYRKFLSSKQVQAEAARVWKVVEDFLFSDGKEVHFKKFMDFRTISGKSNINRIKYDPAARTLTWLGLEIRCYLPKKNREYVLEFLDHKISYFMLKRQMFSVDGGTICDRAERGCSKEAGESRNCRYARFYHGDRSRCIHNRRSTR